MHDGLLNPQSCDINAVLTFPIEICESRVNSDRMIQEKTEMCVSPYFINQLQQ